jgi:hypothetical protein
LASEAEIAAQQAQRMPPAPMPGTDSRAPYGYPQPPQSQGPYPPYNQPQERRPAGRPRETLVESMAKSAVRSIGSSVGRQIIRGLMGSILGGRR